MLSIGAIVQGTIMLGLLAGVLVLFRPLLSGLLRALVLTVRPRRARSSGAINALPSQGA